MKKKEFAASLATSMECTQAEAERTVEAVFSAVKDVVQSGDEISWPGFGKFSRGHRKARDGRNPHTGATLKIAATNTVSFKAAKAFKELVNE